MAKLRAAGEAVPVRSLAVPGRTYILHVPSAYERQRLRGEAAAQGARGHGKLQQLAQLATAVADLHGEEGAAEARPLLARIEAQVRRIHAFAAAAGPDAEASSAAWRVLVEGERDLSDLGDLVRRAGTPAGARYLAMIADDTAYDGLYGLAAARWLLDAVEGPWPQPFTRRAGTPVPAEVLDRIPDEDLDAIAHRVHHESTPSAAEKKASASP